MTPAPGPRIVYAGFATTRPSGGMVVQADHVALLRAAGHDARLWLPGPTPAWFPDVPVLSGATLPIGADDVLVLPEVPVVPGRDPAPGARKVILNQNHFYTLAAGDSPTYPDWSPSPAVWTVSRESSAVLTALHPHLPVTVVPNLVDTTVFVPRPAPRRSVAWIARKRPHETALVHRLLQQAPELTDVDLVPITDSPRAVVAEVLGAATVFVSFGHSEGFGLPVAEALAAGCLVVGHDGGGGIELFDAPGTWRIDGQRPLHLARTVVEVLSHPQAAALGAANRAWVAERYGRAVVEAALERAVAAARARPGAAATATHPAAWLDALPPGFTTLG